MPALSTLDPVAPLRALPAWRLRVGLSVGLLAVGGLGMLFVGAPTPWLQHGSNTSVEPSWGAHDTWLQVSCSVGLGLLLAYCTLFLTRRWVRASRSGHELAIQLAPQEFTWRHALLLGVLPALAEECLFRGFLAQWAGIAVGALAFGLLHRPSQGARWPWALAATGFGVMLSLIYRASGSLTGPIVAHALVNVLNLHALFVRARQRASREAGEARAIRPEVRMARATRAAHVSAPVRA
jgi:hypothetical protein